MGERMQISRVLARLDSHLSKNDYETARTYLADRLAEADALGDTDARLLLLNESMGLYRKLGRQREAIGFAEAALAAAEEQQDAAPVTAATTRINAATVYKAFGQAARALPLFCAAKDTYERYLPSDDARLGGLYNNMGLALVDEGDFREAERVYALAVDTMKRTRDGAPELAVTYLNMADAAAKEHGIEAAEAEVSRLSEAAWTLLDAYPHRDGRYAFVCEKCAPVFGYYGYFAYEAELSARARRIYERA